MTEAQKRFCDEYLIDLNATRAYKVAYPNCKKDHSARTNGYMLLTKTDIQTYIEEAKKEREERTKITQDMVLKELAKIAFFNPKNIFKENNTLKDVIDLDDDIASVMTSVETFEEFDGYGDDREKIGNTTKVKLADKMKALEMLGRHLGMFKDKVEVDVKEKQEKKNNIADIFSQMKEVDD